MSTEALTLLFGALQFVIALLIWLGIDRRAIAKHMPIEPTRNKLIGFLILSGFLFSGYGFYRSTRPRGLTFVQLGDIRFVGPPSPFQPDKPVKLNLLIRNLGIFPAQDVSWSAALAIHPAPESATAEDEIYAEFKKKLPDMTRGVDLGVENFFWRTFATRTLTEQDVRELREGRWLLYVVAYVRYTDGAGTHENEFCRVLEPPGDFPVWHLCSGHNRIR